MAAPEDFLSVVRNLTRDFGTPFEVVFTPPVGAQLRLPHPLVDPGTVSVTDNNGGTLVAATEWAVHTHQGVLRLADAASFDQGVTISGIYYQWFLDQDLVFFVDLMIQEHLHHRTGGSVDRIYGAEVQVVGIGALCLALRSLLTELSTDIDVVSPEGVNIPARQRYSQVQQLLNYWTAQYDEKAAMLNVGLKKIETFDLRRVSRTTERLVPIYRPRELDQHAPPVRVRVPIDPIAPTEVDEEIGYWNDGYGEVGYATDDNFFGSGGW